MDYMKADLEQSLRHAGLGTGDIRKIQGEASSRSFYRVWFRPDAPPHIAMVYPEDNKEEIRRICRLTGVYADHGIGVPGVRRVLGSRILLLQDLGSLSAQQFFSPPRRARWGEKEWERNLDMVAEILDRLRRIAPSHTTAVLDVARMKWEMDFFLEHFACHYLTPTHNLAPDHPLRPKIYRMVESIGPNDTFAHRDFHSRNMLVADNRIYLVDFQDSLVAPPYYDLASFAFDCYLDLGHRRRAQLLECLKRRGMDVDTEQLHITALQRNIKALGTFGFQVTQRHNRAYKKYIPRTLRHITSNPLFPRFFTPADFSAHLP